MRKTIISTTALLLFAAASAFAWNVPDTGDPNERGCNPHAYTDLGNGIVWDNVTGLEWIKEPAPGTYSYNEVGNYIQQTLNTLLVFGGHNDWRLPTVKELSTLVDISIPYLSRPDHKYDPFPRHGFV